MTGQWPSRLARVNNDWSVAGVDWLADWILLGARPTEREFLLGHGLHMSI